MFGIRIVRAVTLLAASLALLSLFDIAHAQTVVIGVNAVNPLRASVADQNALVAQLKAAHVRVIRCGISSDAKGIDFAKRLYAQGIKIQLIVSPGYPPNAPVRPYKPDEFPQMWGGHPLSSADPTLSKAAFQTLFNSLDANGIGLAGVELGNELNWAAFNPEFPLPGEGKTFTLSDLSNDPEGKQIAKGFVQYLKVVTVLKDVRDHSKLNRHTPIISAGMVDAVDGAKLYNNKKEDMVGLSATLTFLRQHGLDSLVDAYGVHTYPSPGQPGNPSAAAQRTAHFMNVAMAECRPRGAGDGKPCWITEWGFPNSSATCPIHDESRALLVKEMRANFATVVAQKRLAGFTYFSWDSDPWSKSVAADSVFRCGELTEAGKLAVAPM
jgi:intracellular sulfur oxidation DsrE/DsrF family protein